MYELSIAIRHLTSRKKMTALSVAAVSVGIMALIVINSLNRGGEVQYIANLLKLTPSVLIAPEENEDQIFMYKSLISTVSDVEHVEYVSPYVITQALVDFEDKTRNVQVRGVVPEDEVKILDLESNMQEGAFEDLDYRSIIIGSKLLDELDAEMEDHITLTTVEGEKIDLKIVGAFSTGSEQFDKGMAYVTLKRAQKMADMTNSVSGISLSTDDIYGAEEVAQEIRDKTGTNAKSWIEINKNFLQLLELNTKSSAVIIAFLVMVAAFGIANTMIMTVMGKVREIGMLKAMGAKPRSIMKIFMTEGLLIGLMGAALGCILGYVFVMLLTIYPITITGAEEFYGAGENILLMVLSPMDFVYSFIIAAFVSIVASILPARRASKLEAVEALAHV